MSLANAAQLQHDHEIIRRLRTVSVPGDDDVIEAGRLFSRYGDHRYQELRELLLAIIREWGCSIQELQAECRRLWASGYRPLAAPQEGVGSGADVGAGD